MQNETAENEGANPRKFRGRLILASLPPDDAGFIKALDEAGLLTIGLEGTNFCFKDKRGQVVAYGAYSLLGKVALMRSCVVLPDFRRKGVGARLIAALLSQLQALGLAQIYLLTESADVFFSSMGFEAISRDNAPEQIRNTGQFKHHCADDAILMVLDLEAIMNSSLDD